MLNGDGEVVVAVSGDRYEQLRQRAYEKWRDRPESIYAFALWHALDHLAYFWSDEQGVSAERAAILDRLVAGPIAILERHRLTDTEMCRDALRHLLRALPRIDVDAR
jgi:hypothetical protein